MDYTACIMAFFGTFMRQQLAPDFRTRQQGGFGVSYPDIKESLLLARPEATSPNVDSCLRVPVASPEGQGFICQWKQSRFQLNIRNNLSKCRGQKVPQFVMPSRGIPARRTHERMMDCQCLTTSTPLSKIKQSETIPDSNGIPKVPLAEDRGGG